MNRDEYEAKLAAKKRRMLELAERRDQEGREAAAKAGAIADRIPMGQPILVGHHSERRHRRDLDRIDRNMRAASEAAGEAEDLRRRAEKVGTTISSEDPDAIDKLEAKIADLEASREAMKTINDAYRRGGWDAVRAKGLMTEAQIADTQRMAKLLPGRDVPFRSYAFTNTAGEIGRIKKRIAELSEGPPALDPIEGEGWRIEARPDLNRVAISFDAKPSAEVTTKLKRGGWRWSPRAGAWLRLFNKATLWAVDDAVKYLPAKAPTASPKDSDRPPPIYETRPTKARESKSAKAATRSKAKAKRSTKSAAAASPRKRTASTKSGAPRKKAKSAKGAKRGGATDGPAFSRFITHPTTRARLDARDYGYKAWPLRGSGTSG